MPRRVRTACLTAALLLLPSLWTAAGGGGQAAALLERVSARYAAARALSADFRQEVPLQRLGIVRKAAGKVYFQRPLRMRWDYQAPNAQLFLADGTWFYFRPPDSPQVFRRRIDERSLGGKVPLLLLFGTGRVSEFFRAAESSVRKGGEEIALRLIPVGEAANEVRRVDLVVGTADALIREVHLYDRLGGANHLYLENTVIDPAFPDRLFRFRPPPGVEVVDR
ncbi:MAG: hypothetical protein Kow00128_04170 [Deltaproteobacteria bacterium]